VIKQPIKSIDSLKYWFPAITESGVGRILAALTAVAPLSDCVPNGLEKLMRQGAGAFHLDEDVGVLILFFIWRIH
jgi:hypothetical protein